jgi:hypothetical protein
VLVFWELFSYNCKEWLSRDIEKDVIKIAYGFILVTVSEANKFTVHKYGVSRIMRETTSFSIVTAIDFFSLQHMDFLRHLVQKTTQLTSLKVQSLPFVQYNRTYSIHTFYILGVY